MSVRSILELSAYRSALHSETYLLKCDKRSSNLGRSELSVVKRNDHGEGSNSYTGDGSSSENVVVGTAVSGGLNDDTDDEPDDSKDDTLLTADGVGNVAVQEHTDPSTELENRGEETREGGVLDTSDATGFREGVHGENLTEHALVVAIDQTTHGGKDSDREGTGILDETGSTRSTDHRETVVGKGLGDMVKLTSSGGDGHGEEWSPSLEGGKEVNRMWELTGEEVGCRTEIDDSYFYLLHLHLARG